MAYRNSKKKSFFAEQRESNTNPNFINNMDSNFIRNNVRRIIRDVADDLILDADYVYFKSDNIINACIQESYENTQINQMYRHALIAYRSIILPNGMITPDINANLDMILSATELQRVTARESIWATANKIFIDISRGADPKATLIYLTRFSKQAIKDL